MRQKAKIKQLGGVIIGVLAASLGQVEFARGQTVASLNQTRLTAGASAASSPNKGRWKEVTMSNDADCRSSHFRQRAEITPYILGMELGVNPDLGLTVDNFAEGSEAAANGVMQGDIVLRANGCVVASPSDLTSALNRAVHGGQNAVLLLVVHNGDRRFVRLSLDAG